MQFVILAGRVVQIKELNLPKFLYKIVTKFLFNKQINVLVLFQNLIQEIEA